MSTPARLVVGERSDEVRRDVGPMAWVALEVITAQAAEQRGELIAVTSVRGVADVLGVAKNTAHRAMHRLALAGLIEPAQPRATNGQFTNGTYRLLLPNDVLTIDHTVDAADKPSPRPRRRRTSRRHEHSAQLNLLADLD